MRIGGKPLAIGDGETANRHAAALRVLHPVVDSVGTRASKRNPAPPFTTSTLQQEASRKLGFSPKRTMTVAQRLYEGVDTPDGHVGLITYMRTDSTAIAGVAMAEAQAVIKDRFGERVRDRQGQVLQDEGEGCPGGARIGAADVRSTVTRNRCGPTSSADELKLYRLVWQRALASQMAARELETTTIELAAGDYRLRASATRTLFDGFARVYTEGQDDSAEEADRTLPALREGDVTRVLDVTSSQHFTEPPPRYTEATLIKALEEHGIGRPSTYAATISTILDRGYVRVEARRLHPEEIGEIVTDYLVAYFGDYVDLTFTARMEGDLDEVARGERAWVPLLRAFFDPLKALRGRRRASDPSRPGEPTDEVCSLGHPMVIRLGRNGKFLACSTYPDHKETRPLPGEETPPLEGDGETCPQCGEGTLTTKRGRFGAFVGCSRYPDCKYIRKDGPPPPDPAAVRGGLPEERGRYARGASREAHRKRLLGVLPIPEVRLHHQRRADGRRPRRLRCPSCGRPWGRGPQGRDAVSA